ncbi:unnamed protein product [Musa acuminata subsp. burmannicoides]
MLLSVLKHSPEQGGELLFELALPFYDEETPGAVSKCGPGAGNVDNTRCGRMEML